MSGIETIFAAWPTARALADDIGVPDVTVRQWRNRSGSIPPKYWAKIQKAAEARGVFLHIDLFTPEGVFARSAAEA